MADPVPVAEFKPDLEAHARLMHTAVETMLGAVAHVVETVPAAAGVRGAINRVREMIARAGALLVDQAPIEAEQQKAKDEAEIARLTQAKIAAVQTAPPGVGVDQALTDHSTATLDGAAAAHDEAVAQAESDAAARDKAIDDARASADRLAALDAAATERARAALGGNAAPLSDHVTGAQFGSEPQPEHDSPV